MQVDEDIHEDLRKANSKLDDLERLMNNSTVYLQLSTTELWLGRILALVLVFAFVILAFSFWIASNKIEATNANIEAAKADIQVVKENVKQATPSDILLAVLKLQNSTLTKDEFRAWLKELEEVNEGRDIIIPNTELLRD